MNLPLMSININIDPDMFEVGPFILTWHGFFTFIAVALAVFLVGRWAKREGFATDPIFSVAVWAIIGGIIGARVLHVIDLWNQVYSEDPIQIIKIWEGGITIYGGILGGFLGGAAYMIIRNDPRFINAWNRVPPLRFLGGRLERSPLPSVGHLADLTTPALLISMALGRIGDIINGEHFARASDLPWALTYSHQETRDLHAFSGFNSLNPTHPAVVYEMMWDLIVLALIWPLRNRLRPQGMFFAMYLAVYSAGKFFISYLRLDKEWFLGLREAQVVALVVMLITITVLILKAQLVRPGAVTRDGGRGDPVANRPAGL